MGKSRTTRAVETLVPEQAAHLGALVFATVEAYQEWCAASGFGTGLRKSAPERAQELRFRQRERGMSSMDGARSLKRHPEATFRLLMSPVPPPGLLQRSDLAAIATLARELPKGGGVRAAFLALLMTAQRHTSLLREDPVLERFGYDIHNSYIGALAALARNQVAWIRPLESWRPRHHSAPRQFASLVRHLLVHYEIPACFDSAWFVPPLRAAEEQQGWYRQLGSGRNPRQVGFPITLTKRMAHLLVTAVPDDLLLTEGLRWAQVVGMGGSAALARAICASGLGQILPDEPFWETVVRFFVNHPLLDLAQVGPLFDYLRHEHDEPHRGNDPTRLPPGFTMAGRSPGALLARMEQWHRRVAHQRAARVTTWEPAAWAGLSVEEKLPESDGAVVWKITELTTAKALQLEGAALHHCVGSYISSCTRGQISVWSLTRKVPWEVGEERVMTIAVTPTRYVTEARGKYNALPGGHERRLSRDAYRVLQRGWHYFQLWATREGLTVPGYLRY